MRRIKVFLGGFVNYTNAQNLNCKFIAENLNKNKFEVYALRVHFGDYEKFNYKTFFCFRPFRMTYHLGFLWGIIKSDVLYLPKHIDTPRWVLVFANFLKKPIFTTIEGNVTDVNHGHNLISLFSSKDIMRKHFSYFNAIFAITERLISNASNILKVHPVPLNLGVKIRSTLDYNKEKLKNIVFIGGLTKKKRVDEFLKLATVFPMLDFQVVGDGPEFERLLEEATDNVFFLGKLKNSEVYKVLQNADILFLPSMSEGFPKVILEAAAAGVPSIVYNTYGASDWMDNNLNGFIVKDFEEVKDVISKLINSPNILQEISRNTLSLASKYDWNLIIKDWEKVIKNLFYAK